MLGVIELEDGKWEAQLREGKPGPSNKRAKSSGAFGTEKAAQDVYDANAHEYGMLTSAEQNAETRALNGKQKVGYTMSIKCCDVQLSLMLCFACLDTYYP